MAKFIITGGTPLKGAIRLGGAKNAGFKLMIAAALSNLPSRILNLSDINDVQLTKRTLEKLGVIVKICGDKTLAIEAKKITTSVLPQLEGAKTRGATLFAGLLLAQTGKAIIPLPGGCVLGTRPVDRHLEGFKALGAKTKYQGKYIHLKAEKLVGGTYLFPKKSHTGTEALMIAAVKAKGKTVIANAGLEPEIDDLIKFLNNMGAQIKRDKERIIINGVGKLKGTIHQVMPDRNEAVSYAVAALATKGDIVLENANPDHLKAFLTKVKEANGNYSLHHYGIRFWYEKPLKATKIQTRPAPGFMTDWQPLWGILMTQANGESEIIERIHNCRLNYCDQLNKMGAQMTLFNPLVKNPLNYYDFEDPQNDPNFHAVKIKGPTALKAAKLNVTDLRAGATMVIAALIAKGRSVLENIEHIDRGYENLDQKLNQLGAKIKRIS